MERYMSNKGHFPPLIWSASSVREKAFWPLGLDWSMCWKEVPSDWRFMMDAKCARQGLASQCSLCLCGHSQVSMRLECDPGWKAISISARLPTVPGLTTR